MHKIRRFINQNMKIILIVIAFCAFIILIIQILNKHAEKSLQEQNLTSNTQRESKPNKSIISDHENNEISYAIHKNVVTKFVEYCNNKDIQKAYELISKDCQVELFPTIQDFKKYYYDNIFAKKRTFSMQNWIDYIYIVRYTEDILSSGKVSDSSTIQDYISIVFEDEQPKLNLNGYLGKTEINKEKNIQNIKLKVLQKRSYMDYEFYDFEVHNNGDDTVILDLLSKTNQTYLVDGRDTKHYSINNESTIESLMVQGNYNKNISIKFDNPYILDRKIKSITFGNLAICNGNNYLGDYKKVIKCSIDI